MVLLLNTREYKDEIPNFFTQSGQMKHVQLELIVIHVRTIFVMSVMTDCNASNIICLKNDGLIG